MFTHFQVHSKNLDHSIVLGWLMFYTVKVINLIRASHISFLFYSLMLLGICRDEGKSSHMAVWGYIKWGNKVLFGYVGPLNSHHSCVLVARRPAEPKWGGFQVLSLALSFPEVITAAPRPTFSGCFLSRWFTILWKYNRSTGVLWPQIYSSTAEKKAGSREEAVFLSIEIKSGLEPGCVSQTARCFSG